MTQPVYSLRVAQVYDMLGSSSAGLSDEEARNRLSNYGQNILVDRPRTSQVRKFSGHVFHPMAILLWIAGLLSLGTGESSQAFLIWAIILINATFSLWQEYRAEQALDSLRRLLPDYTRVMRSGKEALILASEAVIGDLLILAEGDHIPADGRVVESYGLRTNNANLTGEAIPARKYADASLREDIVELERPNLVFAGTSVVSGTGKAVVYSTGMLTQFGRIAHLTQSVAEPPGALQIEIQRVIHRLSWIAVATSVLIFGVAWTAIELPLRESFLLGLGILVAAVPEGLPATVTITLAMAAQRLARRGVLVKTLSKIETLGNISVICTDKSGTLTQNQMTVRDLWVGGDRIRIGGVGYALLGEFSPNLKVAEHQQDIRALLTAAMLCNNARLLPPSKEIPHWSSLGDQTEAAIKVAAAKYGLDESRLEGEYPRLHELPFEARRKRMSTIHRIDPGYQDGVFPQDGTFSDDPPPHLVLEIALVKGSPREILQLCGSILLKGTVQQMDVSVREQALLANDEYARNALRVLALAYRRLPPRNGTYDVEKVEKDLTFIGLMAMMDPPRPEVSQAVNACRQAGIRMLMITGDYGLTAESVARRIGMLETVAPRILTGAELETLDDSALSQIVKEEVIYARMAPEHKLRLVDALQQNGEIVAVTGDGVNDAPALRKADVGVVMGVTGTDVAKEAADLIITNDNFYSIIAAIEEGRAIIDNIRKFITYIFSSNVPEVMPFILAGLFDIPPALTVLHILAIDLGTDLIPALALGAEKPEPNVLHRPPKKKGTPVIDRFLLTRAFLGLGLIEALLGYSGFLLVYVLSNGINLGRFLAVDFRSVLDELLSAPVWVHANAVLVYFSIVIMAQVGNSFACRSETERGRHLGWTSNPFLIFGVLIEIILFIGLALYNIWGKHSLNLFFWMGIVLCAPAIYGIDWLRKRFFRRMYENHRNGLREGRRAG